MVCLTILHRRMDQGGKYQIRRPDLLYPELSFSINGALFEVFRELGGGHRESYYQRATALAFTHRDISFKEQVYVPVYFQDRIVGKYYVDFIVEENIILELKRGKFVQPVSLIKQNNISLI